MLVLPLYCVCVSVAATNLTVLEQRHQDLAAHSPCRVCVPEAPCVCACMRVHVGALACVAICTTGLLEGGVFFYLVTDSSQLESHLQECLKFLSVIHPFCWALGTLSSLENLLRAKGGMSMASTCMPFQHSRG